MKNLIILAMVFFLYALGYAWNTYASKEESRDTSEHTKHISNSVSKKNIQVERKNKNREKKLNHSIETQKPNKEENSQSKQSQTFSPFGDAYMDDVKLAIKPLEGVKPISAVHLEQGVIKQAQVGDIILLPAIDGTNYELEVTQRSISNNGNISINGMFEENGITYHSIITEGGNTALLSFNAPTGSYEVELENGLGYMYLSKDIENERIDYSKSDVIEGIEAHQEEISS